MTRPKVLGMCSILEKCSLDRRFSMFFDFRDDKRRAVESLDKRRARACADTQESSLRRLGLCSEIDYEYDL